MVIVPSPSLSNSENASLNSDQTNYRQKDIVILTSVRGGGGVHDYGILRAWGGNAFWNFRRQGGGG